MTRVRVAIIGAGPSGISQLLAFAGDAQVAAQGGPELVCYEKQSDWGGLWNYTWRSGLDERGEPCHGSMYRYLWSNGPKECLEFPDYGFEEHFGKPVGSYPPRAVLYDYVTGRAKRSGSCIRDNIRFDHTVRSVTRSANSGKRLAVTAFDHVKGKTATEDFDWVVVASGHFSTPNMPHFPGYKTFPGKIMHSHDFRDAAAFAGHDLLLIGSSYSAEDIALQCWKYGARSVIISSRSGPMGFNWPDTITERPLVTRVEGRTAHFTDGTSSGVDDIISCTGYLHHFPFMSDELRLDTTNRLAPSMLYRGVVFQQENRVLYLGMQDQWYTFTMFDAQAWYARDVIMGRISLPNPEKQAQWIAESQATEDAITDYPEAIWFQGEHIRDLAGQTDYPDYSVPLVNEVFMQWKRHRKQSIVTYRDHGYTSPVTGKVAPDHHTPWADAMDDSLESFLADSA